MIVVAFYELNQRFPLEEVVLIDRPCGERCRSLIVMKQEATRHHLRLTGQQTLRRVCTQLYSKSACSCLPHRALTFVLGEQPSERH